ncbi:hypothetical protein GCK32_010232, partial [Trichostrongylus colubriformis]
EEVLGSFPPDVIDHFPVDLIEDIVMHLHTTAGFLDDTVIVEAKNVVNFFKGCMTRYGKKMLWRSFTSETRGNVDADDGASPSSRQSPSLDTAHYVQDPECSGIDSAGPSVEVRDWLPSESPDDPQACVQEGSTRLPGRCCTLCGAFRPDKDMRSLSKFPAQRLILIGSLFMGNLICFDTARLAYNESHSRRVRICKNHFVEAALFISIEIQRLWGSYPGHGFLMPSSVRFDCLQMFQKFGRSIAKNVELDENDLTHFYNECMAKYHDEVCWRRMDHPKAREKSPISQFSISSSNHSPDFESSSIGDGPEPCTSIRKRKLTSANSFENEPNGKKAKQEYFCAVCGVTRAAEECREASLLDLLIVIACMIMDYKIDADFSMKLRKEIAGGWRHLCAKHYIEAKRLAIMNEELTCFFNDCEMRYQIVQQVEEKSAIQSREERMQASVASVIDEVVAQSSTHSSLDPNQPSGEGSVMLDGEGGSCTGHESDQHSNDEWLTTEVEFGSLNLRRKVEVSRKVTGSSARMERCDICDQVRSADNFRRTTSDPNRITVLLSLLLNQGVVGIRQAKRAYKGRFDLYVCHEHIIQAGAFLFAKIEDKIGSFDWPRLCNLPSEFVSELVYSIQLYGELITDEVKPEAADLYIFLNDYMCGYWANSEWKIKEKPMESMSDARSLSPFISVAQLSANVESDTPSAHTCSLINQKKIQMQQIICKDPHRNTPNLTHPPLHRVRSLLNNRFILYLLPYLLGVAL